MTPQTEVPTIAPQQNPSPSPTYAAPSAGFKSSEFLTTVVSAVALSSGYVPPHYSALVASIAGLYVAARTFLKAVHALGYTKNVPDLPQLPQEVQK